MENEFDKSSFDKYTLSDDKKAEAKLWKEAVFVFDSCALLDFYYLPTKTRKEIYEKTFEKHSGRFWIPNHVQFEYLKNRGKCIEKPVSEKYGDLRSKIESIREMVISGKNGQLTNAFDDILKYTKEADKHPHIEPKEMEKFKADVEKANSKAISTYDKAFAKIEKRIDEIEEEVRSVKDNDDLLENIEKHFSVGNEFSFEELIEITKEGKHRYDLKIPPGYADYSGKNKKEGVQQFGDFIIWKQILEFSKEKGADIIFITNDTTKDNDWCYSGKENRVERPREELIKEISDYSSASFWMYNLEQFLYHSNEYLDSNIEEETIKDTKEITVRLGSVLSDEDYQELENLAQENPIACSERMNEIWSDSSTVGTAIKFETLKNKYPQIDLPQPLAEHIESLEASLEPIRKMQEAQRKHYKQMAPFYRFVNNLKPPQDWDE